MKTKLHVLGAVIATLCIATFFTSTIVVEVFGSVESVASIKRLIVSPGLFILIPAIAITGATGFNLSKSRKGRLIEVKKKRMPIIAANGLLILVPAAIFLGQWATSGLFDTRFYIVQGVELIAGAVNLVFMGMNIRDGMRLSGKGMKYTD